MTLKRMLDDESAQASHVDLIRLARSETPSAESRARILNNLDAALVSIAAPAAAHVSTAGGSAKTSSLLSSGAVKWAAIVGLGVSLPLAAYFVVANSAGQKQKSAASTGSSVTQVKAPVQQSESATAPEKKQDSPPIKTVNVDDLPLADVGATNTPETDRAPKAVTPSLAEELAAIQRARALLSKGDGRATLRELEAYRTRFPRGRLAPEALVLRIEALVTLGDRQTARTQAARFIAANPQSAYVPRIKSLVGEDVGR